MSDIEKTFNTLYTLGEAQYSGKKIKSNGILHVSLKGRFNYYFKLLIIIDRSNILDDWLMFTFDT
jgi:hypothetical protein